MTAQLDFKQIGEVAGLTVAAARMRYSRLRKAVETGEFHGAYIHQPQGASPQMLELANPKSRQAKSKSSGTPIKTSPAVGFSVYSSARKTPKRLKPDEKEESSDDKKTVTTPSQRRSTRKRKADQISDDGKAESFFIPDEAKTDLNDDTEDEFEPEESDEPEEMDDDHTAKAKRPLSTSRKIAAVSSRNKGPFSSSVAHKANTVGGKMNEQASVPRFSFFSPSNSSAVNEDEELEEDEIEEQSRTQGKQASLVKNILKQHMKTSPGQYSRQVSSNGTIPQAQFPGDTMRASPYAITGQHVPTATNYSYFMGPEQHSQSGQSNKDPHSTRPSTHSYRIQQDGKQDYDYRQSYGNDDDPNTRPLLPTPTKGLRPCRPPSGFFSPPQAQKRDMTGWAHNAQNTPMHNSIIRSPSNMPPPPSIPTYRNTFTTKQSAPIDHSHPSSVLDGFAVPPLKHPDSLYGNPIYPQAIHNSRSPRSPYPKSHPTNTNTSNVKQHRTIDTTSSSPLSAPSPRPAPTTHRVFVQPAPSRSTALSPPTPTPATRPAKNATKTVSAQDKDKDKDKSNSPVAVGVTLSIESTDKEVQADTPTEVESDVTSQLTEEDVRAASTLMAMSRGQSKEDIEAGDSLVAMSRGQGKEDQNEA